MLSRLSLPFLLSFLPLAGCAAPAARPLAAPIVDSSADTRPDLRSPQDESFGLEELSGWRWAEGQPLMHGFIGVSSFSKVEVEGSGAGSTDGDEGDLDQLPLIGGGAQWKLGGQRIDFGLEGLLSFSGRADAEAFAVGGSGAVVAIDVDLMLFELYGGPFASLFLGEKLRLYGAAGPLLQFAEYQQTGSGLADDGSGFGAGYYVRTGLEYALPSRTLIGFGVRWSDTTVDLGSGLGDLDIDGLQYVLTVSRGL